MKVEYQGHKARKKQANEFWANVVADNNAGIPVAQIATRYRNPLTGKHYTREHIYWILRKMANNK